MSNVVVIAPHPDDETLGCGGTLMKHKLNGDSIYWVIVTGMDEKEGFTSSQIERRDVEIQEAAVRYGFEKVYRLGFPTTRLDEIPMNDLVRAISNAIQEIKPVSVYVPYRGDVHTDHHYVFDAVISCTKWFRYTSIRKVLAYETLSETDFGINPDSNGFRPNVFVNISGLMDQKIQIMRIFQSEIGEFPFPRSEIAMRALANLRGAAAGVSEAEAFMLLREIVE